MDLIDVPEPNEKLLESARSLASTLVARAQSNIGVLFERETLDALKILRDDATPEYMVLEVQLEAVPHFSKQDLRRAIKARGEPTAPATQKTNESSWLSRLSYTKDRCDATEANVVSALVHAPEWKGVLAYNEFATCVVTRKSPPWFPDDQPHGGAKEGEWTDEDDTRLVCWLQRRLDMHASVGVALAGMVAAARRAPFHPVREYLDGLAWDGVERLHDWLAVYAGARTQPAEYLTNVGTWFLISAVARIYEPGCQADHCIILEGAQGAGKSTLARTLVPDGSWFAVHNAALTDKDSYAILRGRWLIEMAELDSIARVEASRSKRYMTERVDSYRPVWARRVAQFPRQCVFIGTVNDSTYLRDTTGNRRYWPVTVGVIDVAALQRDRDQLWAEAVVKYREGVRWHPETSDDVGLLTTEQDSRVHVDPWVAPIDGWLSKVVRESPEPVRLRLDEVMTGALRIQIGDAHPGQAERIGRIMTQLGWVRKRLRSPNEDMQDRDHEGKKRRHWYYEPPPS